MSVLPAGVNLILQLGGQGRSLHKAVCVVRTCAQQGYVYYQSRGVAVPVKMCDGRTLQDGVRGVFRALACLCAQLGLECCQVGGRMGWNNCYLQAVCRAAWDAL